MNQEGSTEEEDIHEQLEQVIDRYCEPLIREVDASKSSHDIVERAFRIRRILAQMVTDYLKVGGW